MAAAKRNGAPPFRWTEKIEDEIFRRLADGEAIRNICGTGRDDWLPSWPTVLKRLEADDSFAARYARAREAQADKLFDECLAIADDAANDYVDTENGPTLNHEHVQRARLRIDTRRWMAGKLRPKVYGDKLDVEHSGGLTIKVADSFDPE